jgi:hypothetical protein
MFTARVIAAVLIGLNLILMNGYWIGVIPAHAFGIPKHAGKILCGSDPAPAPSWE